MILAVSVTAIGFYAASVVKKRVILLEMCVKLLKSIAVDIGYCSETVLVIVKKAAMNREFAEFSFLNNLSDCENSDFSKAWSTQLEKFRKHSALNTGDIDLLKSFGNKLGTTDSFHQTQLCEEYIKIFEERCEYEKSKLSERLRVYKTGGAACGLALLILLI